MASFCPFNRSLHLSFGARPLLITSLSASYSLMQFLFVPFWGVISDRYGRRIVMLISIAMSAFGFCLFSLADSMLWLFLSRMVAGIGGANIGCAQAIIADISSKEDRIKGMGIVSAAMGFGFIVGPILGGGLARFSFALPALVSAGLAVINLFVALAYLKETRPSAVVARNTAVANTSFSWFRGLKTDRYENMTVLYLLSFMIIMAFALFEQSIGMYVDAHFSSDKGESFEIAKNAYRMSIERTSFLLAMIAIVAAMSQLFLLKNLSRLWGEKGLLSVGVVSHVALSLAALPIIGN